MVGLILDVIVIAIIVLNIFIGYKKGLVKLAVGLIAVFASLILAAVFYRPVSSLIINNTEIDDNIKNGIIENFSGEENTEDNKTDDGFIKYIEQYVDDSVNKTRNEIVIEASDVVAEKVINICVAIGIFIVARLVLILLTFVADAIMSLPILKQFNEVGGIAYGAIKALLIVYVLLAIAFFVIYTTGNTSLSDAIASSYVTKFFYNNNILLKIIF